METQRYAYQRSTRVSGPLQLLTLIRYLYLSGAWLGDLRADNEKKCVLKNLDSAQNLLFILGSTCNIIGGICMIFKKKESSLDNKQDIQIIFIYCKKFGYDL